MSVVGRVVAFLVCATLIASTAEAQTVGDIDPQNFNAERFRLGIDRDSMMNVEWADVPPHLAWDLGVWLGYADDPLVLYQLDPNGKRNRVGSLVSGRLGAGIAGAIALFDWAQLGFELPISLTQTRDDAILSGAIPIPVLSGAGLGDLRIVPKIRLLTERVDGMGLALIPMFTLSTGSSGNYFGDDKATFSPMLAFSKKWDVVKMGANFGYTFKNNIKVLDLEVADELFLNAGPGFQFGRLGLDLTFGLTTAAKGFFKNANQSYGELLGSAKYDMGMIMPFVGAGRGGGGGGGGVIRGYGTPDWRVLFGVRFSGGRGIDSDHDGLFDAEDRCPQKPEDVDQFEDADGCPDTDNDKDGVLDVNDGAPNDPEDKDGFEDADGIPDLDNDRDGVPDLLDKCPLHQGPADSDGCPDTDSDGDGILDGIDKCPSDKEDVDDWKDSDGCPDPDNDRDGVVDTSDECPLVKGPLENRGCPDGDRDGDKVVDRKDNCPDVPGTIENYGCKDKQLVVITGEKLDILDKVYFKTNSSRILARSFPLLRNVASVLKGHPEIEMIEVQGHTDSRGSNRSNLSLSQRRAASVRSFVIGRGIKAGRLRAKGYGETLPIETNDTREGQAANRRVEFNIVGGSDRVKAGDSRKLEIDN